MPYTSFYEKFPEIAEKETKVITAIADPELPEGNYALIESYCDEIDCDCRRVFLNIFGSLGPGTGLWTGSQRELSGYPLFCNYTLVLLFEFSHGTQGFIPSGFKAIGHQPVIRIHSEEPTLSQFGFVTGTFQS